VELLTCQIDAPDVGIAMGGSASLSGRRWVTSTNKAVWPATEGNRSGL
jgi:hypothetical protein